MCILKMCICLEARIKKKYKQNEELKFLISCPTIPPWIYVFINYSSPSQAALIRVTMTVSESVEIYEVNLRGSRK